jgi:carbon monoxide dehydrogenase subunit G
MKFENEFTVHAPIGDVWATLMDVERVAPCMPGAEVLERLGDDSYKVGIKVKLGPISMLYRGQVDIVERDEAEHTAIMRAKAREARGQGTADAQVHMSLHEEAVGTRARMETEMQMSGKAAAMGRGVVADVSARLVDEFAANLAALMVPAPAAASDGATAAEPAAQMPPPPTAAPASESSLPVGKIAAGVISGRLSDPRTLALAVLSVAVAGGVVGYALGRR